MDICGHILNIILIHDTVLPSLGLHRRICIFVLIVCQSAVFDGVLCDTEEKSTQSAALGTLFPVVYF